jgi:hypothetical protein
MIKNNPTSRLVKHIIRSYARLADNKNVRSNLKERLPPIMKDKSFINKLDESSKKWMANLWRALSEKANPIVSVPQQPNPNFQSLNLGLMNPLVMGQQQMNQIPNQLGYMMQQQPNEYGYGIYNDVFASPKPMFMQQGGMGHKGYGGVNAFYGYKNN